MDAELENFRLETRTWLEENCPPEMRLPIKSDDDQFWGGRNPTYSSPAQKQWFDAMVAKRWVAPQWPVEYGGAGLDPDQTRIVQEEMARINARPPLASFGIWMLGPALLKYGTEEQKRHYLPQITRGEIRWCQGYSEPGSGSDLASLATRAEDKDDHWLLNGQKIWTSYANKADWIFCLVRTDPTAPKHLGISFVLFDMRTPGVTTRPIKLISGDSAFCETFFDDVVVPKANLVGTLNRGWDVAKYLLSHEREMISAFGLTDEPALGAAFADLRERDPVLRGEIAMFDVRSAAFRACSELFSDEIKAGLLHPAKASMMKYLGTELNKSRQELLMAAEGFDGLSGARNDGPARHWLRSKGNSIEGGTSEVQLNILAKHILTLPGA